MEDIDFTLQKEDSLEYIDRNYAKSLNGDCFILVPSISPAEKTNSCHLKNMNSLYSIDKFNEPRHPPIRIGKVCEQQYEKLDISVVDLLLKVAGDDTYYVPDELLPIKETLQMAIDFFHSNNSSATGSYYCTVRSSSCMIPPNGRQRFQAIHADGVLGPRFRDRNGKFHSKDCSIFTITNSMETDFFVESMDVSKVDIDHCDLGEHFEKHVSVPPIKAQDPYELVMFDGYTLHRSPANTSSKAIMRKFVNINFYSHMFDIGMHTALNPRFLHLHRKQQYRRSDHLHWLAASYTNPDGSVTEGYATGTGAVTKVTSPDGSAVITTVVTVPGKPDQVTVEHVDKEGRTIDNKQPTEKDKAAESIKNAVAVGRKRWARSKIMIVGEGRAGKTALANSIMGKSFTETQSTVGINELKLEINYARKAAAGGGKEGASWDSYTKPEKELEAAIAQMVRTQMQSGKESNKESELRATTEVDVNVASNSVDTILPEVSNELVMKCLAQSVETTSASDLIIALYDYGGQSVFNSIHHLFLTANGVYMVTFNMEWLLSEGPALQACFDYLDFWVKSIIVHTLNLTTMYTAPVVFVGTRKDRVTSPSDHQKISLKIFERYSNSMFWPMVIENPKEKGVNGTTLLYFYPIDNTAARNDPSFVNLLDAAEAAMNAAKQTNEMVPLPWLKTLDVIQSQESRSCFLPLVDVQTIGQAYNLTEDSIREMLLFFHEMGLLLWHDEDGLRDVVILDAIAYFVVPVTTIICKHVPDKNDPTSHLMDVHKKCRKQCMAEWRSFVEKGIVTETMLKIFWESQASEYDRLVQLMIKFGLMVSITAKNDESDESSKYLVPSLLSSVDVNSREYVSNDWTDASYQSCFFVFTIDPSLSENTTLLQGDLVASGFLPSGLFERIISKILIYCQSTARYGAFSYRNVEMHRNMAILHFGSQRFRMTACPIINSILVDVEGSHPQSVHTTLTEIVSSAIAECVKSLSCFTALFHSSLKPSASSSTDLHNFAHKLYPSGGSEQQSFIVPVKHLWAAAVGRSPLMKAGGRKLFDSDEIQRRYGLWLRVPRPLDEYDVFISYRWKPFNSVFVSLLFDMLSNFALGQDHRAIEVFLDKKRLQTGRKFDFDFVKAIYRSTIVVPVVSVESLVKMSDPDVNSVDNVLLEWIVSLELVSSSVSSNEGVKALLPAVFGESSVDVNDILSDSLFESHIYKNLPEIIPVATLNEAAVLLNTLQTGAPLSSGFMEQTIRSIVTSLLKFKGFLAWHSAPHMVLEDIALSCCEVLQNSECPKREEQKVTQEVAATLQPAVSSGTDQSQSQLTTSNHVAAAVSSPSPPAGASDGSPRLTFLHTSKNISNEEGLAALLEELGVYCDQDILDLDPPEVGKITEFIKVGRRKAFSRLLAS